MITLLIWTIWNSLSAVPRKAVKFNHSLTSLLDQTPWLWHSNVYGLWCGTRLLHLARSSQPSGKVFYASAFRRRRHYVFGLSVRPSVRPKHEIPSFDLYIGPLVHPTNRYRSTACPSVRPSVRPERFPDICRRLHGGISLKFYMLMYLDHLQNWLVYGHGLVIFLILALFGLSETGQIWGFRVFPGECMEEMTWNFARWCILTTFRTD